MTEPLTELSTQDDGIPLLINQNSWFFQYSKHRQDGDIDKLWQVFADEIAFADRDFGPSVFIGSYDTAESQPRVAYNLTMGLYWARPWSYVPLDGNSRRYITNRLGIPLSGTIPPSGVGYVDLCNQLAKRFEEDNCPVHSFPELSWAAYQPDLLTPPHSAPSPQPQQSPRPEPAQRYTIDDIINEGCFLHPAKLEMMLQRLQTKRNLILQGPPGTGKTWLFKKLAYALIGYKDDSKIRPLLNEYWFDNTDEADAAMSELLSNPS